MSRSFEHVPPETVGNERRFLMSEVSGRTTVLAKLSTVAHPELCRDSPEVARIVARLKELEHEGYQFEAADASFELMVLKALGRFAPHFSLSMYRISGEYPCPDGDQSASAHALHPGGRPVGNHRRHGQRPRARAGYGAAQGAVRFLPPRWRACA